MSVIFELPVLNCVTARIRKWFLNLTFLITHLRSALVFIHLTFLPRVHAQRGKVIGSVIVVVVVVITRSRVVGVPMGVQGMINAQESEKIVLFAGHAYQPHLHRPAMAIVDRVS